MEPFSYDPLDSATREIRVLDLLPGCGDTIECRLRHLSLHAPKAGEEPYEALSYCWGDDAVKVAIAVNGRALLVTPNLHTALRHLRGRGPADAPRTLWVDAVCINQEDNAEKEVQVLRMADVYTSCRRAVIWLGAADAHTRPGFDGLRLIAAMPALGDPDPYDFVMRHWRGVRRGRPDAAAPRWAGSRFREAAHFSWTVHYLFTRPWFTRLWVVQELALCPRAVVRCGPFEMDWDVVARAYARWPGGLEYSDHLGALLRIREPPAPPHGEDFLDLMLKVWHKDCKDPRDKIYGLVGLARARNIDIPVAVDYNKDANDVFTDLTRCYLQRTQNLQILALCRGCKTASGPSWAINPAYSKAHDPLPQHSISWHPGFSGALRAGGVRHQPLERCTSLFDGNLLCLEGYCLDTVVAVSLVNRRPPVMSTLGEILEDFHRVTGNYRFYLDAKRLLPAVTHYNPTGQRMMEAFWCAIMAACPPHPTDPDDGNQKYSSGKLQELLTSFEMVDRNLARYTGLLAMGGLVLRLTLAFIYVTMILSLLRGKSKISSDPFFTLSGITERRRFFVTADGYFGLGPHTTMVGDQVLILRGHGVPIVARKRRHWLVVGDCHLQGAMEGEAFEVGKCRPLWFA